MDDFYRGSDIFTCILLISCVYGCQSFRLAGFIIFPLCYNQIDLPEMINQQELMQKSVDPMARLEIFLFGAFHVRLISSPVD